VFRTISSQLSPVSTMAAKSQQSTGRDGTLAALNAAIDVLNLAKDASGIAPAQAAFGSVNLLLAMIRVRPLLFYGDGLSIHIYQGFDGQRTGFRRAWAELCRDLWSARSRYEREEVGRPQSIRA
jgi:hypothetical protein